MVVYRTCAEMAAVSHDTSHVTTKQHCKYTILVDIQKRALKTQSLIYNHTRQEHNESAGGWRIALQKSDQQQWDSPPQAELDQPHFPRSRWRCTVWPFPLECTAHRTWSLKPARLHVAILGATRSTHLKELSVLKKYSPGKILLAKFLWSIQLIVFDL